MVLKTYVLSSLQSGLVSHQLDKQISESGSVDGFEGIIVDHGSDSIHVNGALILNESALDTVVSNHVPDATQVFVNKTVYENKLFSDALMQRLKEKNLLEGLASIDQAAWVHHRLRKVAYTLGSGVVVQIDVLNLVVSGDIETAEQVLGQVSPDDMTQAYHWWNQDRINWVRNEIRTYLGWPLI